MVIRKVWLVGFLSFAFAMSCTSKKEEKGDVSASLMKSEALADSLAISHSSLFADVEGSVEQSFTPSSLKLPIFGITLCRDDSNCERVYKCSGTTVEECGVELSDIDAFVDTINAAPTQIEDGSTFDHIAVQFCPDGDTSGVQHITLNGSTKIQGTDYATDPDLGLVPGTTGKDVSVAINGGCASYYPITPNVTISKGTPTTVKLFFDASLYAFAGIEGESFNKSRYSSDCAGSLSAYVCTPVITVVASVESGNPTAEHYLLSDTNPELGGSDDSAPTGAAVLYFNSSGDPIGGVQNLYRMSGTTINWGRSMDGGLGLYPKTVDSATVSFGEPEGSVSLANWFKAFKRETHTGTYTYSMQGEALESTYKATKL